MKEIQVAMLKPGMKFSKPVYIDDSNLLVPANVEIREKDLKFSSEEAVTFLSHSMGLHLSTEEMFALTMRTEGWITGLQMAALSLLRLDGQEVSRFIADFSEI